MTDTNAGRSEQLSSLAGKKQEKSFKDLLAMNIFLY
jgi:hypothetical protein